MLSRKMLDRLGKNIRKVQDETDKKIKKLSNKGIEMSYSTCHNKSDSKIKYPRGTPVIDVNPDPSFSYTTDLMQA